MRRGFLFIPVMLIAGCTLFEQPPVTEFIAPAGIEYRVLGPPQTVAVKVWTENGLKHFIDQVPFSYPAISNTAHKLHIEIEPAPSDSLQDNQPNATTPNLEGKVEAFVYVNYRLHKYFCFSTCDPSL